MKQVIIYTDGACSGNPGPGGWGAVLLFNEFRREMSGYAPSTTNNRMELTAAIEALGALREPCEVRLHSDSSYLINAFEQHWLDNWVRRSWIKSDKKPVENRDLWEKLLALTKIHRVTWLKVKGHANNRENNRCDEMATGAIRQARDARKGLDD